MSELPPGVDVKYESVKIKIVKGDDKHPLYWYNKCIGQVLDAERRIWTENGEVTHVNYVVPRTPGGGFDGYIPNESIEVIDKKIKGDPE